MRIALKFFASPAGRATPHRRHPGPGRNPPNQRRVILAQLDSLYSSLLLDMFGDPVANPKQWDVVPFGTNIATSLRNGLSPSSDGIMTAKVLTLSAITGGGFNADAWKLERFTPLRSAVS